MSSAAPRVTLNKVRDGETGRMPEGLLVMILADSAGVALGARRGGAMFKSLFVVVLDNWTSAATGLVLEVTPGATLIMLSTVTGKWTGGLGVVWSHTGKWTGGLGVVCNHTGFGVVVWMATGFGVVRTRDGFRERGRWPKERDKDHEIQLSSDLVHPLCHNCDQHLLSPYHIATWSNIKVMRIEEMINKE